MSVIDWCHLRDHGKRERAPLPAVRQRSAREGVSSLLSHLRPSRCSSQLLAADGPRLCRRALAGRQVQGRPGLSRRSRRHHAHRGRLEPLRRRPSLPAVRHGPHPAAIGDGGGVSEGGPGPVSNKRIKLSRGGADGVIGNRRARSLSAVRWTFKGRRHDDRIGSRWRTCCRARLRSVPRRLWRRLLAVADRELGERSTLWHSSAASPHDLRSREGPTQAWWVLMPRSEVDKLQDGGMGESSPTPRHPDLCGPHRRQAHHQRGRLATLVAAGLASPLPISLDFIGAQHPEPLLAPALVVLGFGAPAMVAAVIGILTG